MTPESSSAIGECVARRLRSRCKELASLPGTLGVPREEFGAGIGSTPSGRHVIVFRYAGNALEVVNIVEGHRDLDAFFQRHARVKGLGN